MSDLSAPPAINFMTLPREIRDMVYQMACGSSRPSVISTEHIEFLDCDAYALLSTRASNNQISSEAREVFFSKATFIYPLSLSKEKKPVCECIVGDVTASVIRPYQFWLRMDITTYVRKIKMVLSNWDVVCLRPLPETDKAVRLFHNLTQVTFEFTHGTSVKYELPRIRNLHRLTIPWTKLFHEKCRFDMPMPPLHEYMMPKLSTKHFEWGFVMNGWLQMSEMRITGSCEALPDLKAIILEIIAIDFSIWGY